MVVGKMGQPPHRVEVFLFRLRAVEYQLYPSWHPLSASRQSHLQIAHSTGDKSKPFATIVSGLIGINVDMWDQGKYFMEDAYGLAEERVVDLFASLRELGGGFVGEADSRRSGFVAT